MAYHLRGFIVADMDKEFYDYFGYQTTAPKDIKAWLDAKDADNKVTINSYGGDVFAAAEIFNDLAGNVDIEIVGLAASAAGLVAMAGKTVKMNSLAEIMIHNVSTYGGGDYRDFERTAEELRKANESIRNAYKYRTGLQLTDDELQSMMDNETWLTARDAKEMGFVDEIMNTGSQNNYGGFKNCFAAANMFFNAASVRLPATMTRETPDNGVFIMQRQALELEKFRYGGK